MTHFVNLPTPAKQPIATSRFRYIDPETDIEYRGEAEISTDNEQGGYAYQDANILRVWAIGIIDIEEIEVHNLPTPLILEIEAKAVEQYNNPPALQIEIPSDWQDLEIVQVVNLYTLRFKGAVDSINEDEAKAKGLKVIKSIKAGQNNLLEVKATGGVAEVHKELKKLRIF